MTTQSRHDDGLEQKLWNGFVLDARLQLLDRQLHDHDGNPIGVVDDLDLDLDGVVADQDIPDGAPAPTVASLVTGHVLATRFFGGRPPTSQLQFIRWDLVKTLGVVITLRRNDSQFDSLWVERWLRRHVIGRIPGGRHAPE
jgi:hypothetical protein